MNNECAERLTSGRSFQRRLDSVTKIRIRVNLCLESVRRSYLTDTVTPQDFAFAALPVFEALRIQEPVPCSFLTGGEDIVLLLDKVYRRQPFSDRFSLDTGL